MHKVQADAWPMDSEHFLGTLGEWGSEELHLHGKA
jgi:hypothetical protein